MSASDAPGVPGVGVVAWSASPDGYPDEGNRAVSDQIDPSVRTGNMLLDVLGLDERAAVLSDARIRPITVGDVLLQPGDPIVYVPFPTLGTLSMVTQPDDIPVEAATIGPEGAAGIHSALGSRVASQELQSQVEGEMITIGIERFAKQAGEGRFQDLVYGYLEAMVVQISLTAACNAIHHLNQRCARWLLQTHDRVDSDTFGLTQEYLGVMLGVQRPSVSIAQRTLQAAGCITFRRGSITVVDREALEAAACACYELIRTEYSRLVPLQVQH
jgi:CRP-like cAMP-binding protein